MLRKTYRLRMFLLAVLSLAAFGIIEAALIHYQIRDHEDYESKASYQQHKKVVLTPRRGDIVDRNGIPLATSHFSDTIIFDTRKLSKAPEGLIEDLARALAQSDDTSPQLISQAEAERNLRRYIASPKRRIIMRKAPQVVAEAVALVENKYQLPHNVIIFESHSKRVYPTGSLASHVLGFTTIDDSGDNIGLSGLERQYDDLLKGQYQEAYIPVSSGLRRRGLAPVEDSIIDATFGHDLVLTIDQKIQMFLESTLARQVGAYQAKGGVAVVMDVATGEILALANCPDFDLNRFRLEETDPAQMRNRALTDPIEIGSVMKILTTTLLLDNNLLSTEELIDCKKGYAVIEGRVIRDAHPLDMVPFHRTFAESSNIAMATLATQRLEQGIYYAGLNRFGVGRPTGVDLPGESGGILRPVHEWTRQSPASLAIGYETALTPMQVISAVAAIGNNGWRMRPHLVREVRTHRGRTIKTFDPEPVERVASEGTCGKLLALMEEVVLDGTAPRAAIPGYRVGGKTGTTRKHTEEPRYFASFAGLAPIDDPKIAIYIYIDEPQGAKYGGTVAAPIFREVAEHALFILGVPPNDPEAYAAAMKERAREMTLAMGKTAPVLPVEEAEVEAAEAPQAPGSDGLPAVALPEEASAAGIEGTPMPDCRGLTMIEAWDRLGDAGIEARMLGSGIAVSQEPAAGKPLPEGKIARVVFAHPSKVTKTARSGSDEQAE